jgi:uncharacterized protein (TIGR03435 family)
MVGRQMSGGTLILEKAPLPELLQYAFDAKPWAIVSMPKWAASACYNIAAKSDTPANGGALWPMLVPLFEERFGMKWHREKREGPVYDLILEKSGKLPAPREGNCIGSDLSKAPTQLAHGGRMLTACGGILAPMSPPAGMGLYGGKVRMATLAANLTRKLGRPVIDKTGFTGLFDLDLHFAFDDSLAGTGGRFAADPTDLNASDPSGEPSIFAALRQQLGLKLVPAKGPVEVIVIDHLEKPSLD